MTLLTTNSKKSLKKNGHFALGEWFSFFFGHFIFFFHFNRCASYDPPSLLHLSSVSGPSLCIISVFLFTCVQFNPQARSHSYRPSCNSCTHSHANLIVVTTCPTFVFQILSSAFSKVFSCSWECGVRHRHGICLVAHARTTPPPVFHALNALSLSQPLSCFAIPPFIPLSIPRTALLRSCLGTTTPPVLLLAPAFDRECNKSRRPSPTRNVARHATCRTIRVLRTQARGRVVSFP